jgi:hypothetical protein
MPPGVAVVDAFKSTYPVQAVDRHHRRPHRAITDLIRHGKHHNHARNDELSAPPQSADSSRSRSRAQPPVQQQQTQPAPPPERQAAQQPAHTQPAGVQQHNKAQPYAKEVQQIVAEERESAAKMPKYKGLERFQLLDKMGECVARVSHFGAAAADIMRSGAFSNVYKAVDIVSGQRVAGA